MTSEQQIFEILSQAEMPQEKQEVSELDREAFVNSFDETNDIGREALMEVADFYILTTIGATKSLLKNLVR